MNDIIIIACGGIIVYMSILFLAAQKLKDISIIDIGWGGGFVVMALLATIDSASLSRGHVILLAMIGLWGGRLSSHLFLRSVGKPEDSRYTEMRQNWKGNAALNAFFRVFMVQAALMLIIGSPILISFSSPEAPINFLAIGGMLLFFCGFIIESISDLQLQKFIRTRTQGKRIMTSGLWKFSRHPNYFGEALAWWGIGFFVFAGSGSFFAFAGPALLNFLLLKVSGVPMLEKKYQGLPEWEDYKKKTPVFIPWVPINRE